MNPDVDLAKIHTIMITMHGIHAYDSMMSSHPLYECPIGIQSYVCIAHWLNSSDHLLDRPKLVNLNGWST